MGVHGFDQAFLGAEVVLDGANGNPCGVGDGLKRRISAAAGRTDL